MQLTEEKLKTLDYKKEITLSSSALISDGEVASWTQYISARNRI